MADSSTNALIPFAAISYNNGQGIYTNESGNFSINTDSVKTITISHVSYKPKSFTSLSAADTLKLEPDFIQLQDVVITKNKRKTIKFNNGRNTIRVFMPFIPSTEFIIFVKPTVTVINKIIDEVQIPCYINNVNDGPEDRFVVRISIYNLSRDVLYTVTAEFTLKELKHKGVFYSPAENVKFDKEGLYFGIELLGYYKNNLFINYSYPNFNSTIKFRLIKTAEYNTYYRNPFEANNEWQYINAESKMLGGHDNSPKGMAVELNLVAD